MELYPTKSVVIWMQFWETGKEKLLGSAISIWADVGAMNYTENTGGKRVWAWGLVCSVLGHWEACGTPRQTSRTLLWIVRETDNHVRPGTLHCPSEALGDSWLIADQAPEGGGVHLPWRGCRLSEHSAAIQQRVPGNSQRSSANQTLSFSSMRSKTNGTQGDGYSDYSKPISDLVDSPYHSWILGGFSWTVHINPPASLKLGGAWVAL